MINNITRVTNKPNLNEAIADTRTTGHFILPGAPMDDVQPATQPIEIEMPNGTTEKKHAHVPIADTRHAERSKRSTCSPRTVALMANINKKIVQGRMRS